MEKMNILSSLMGISLQPQKFVCKFTENGDDICMVKGLVAAGPTHTTNRLFG